MTTIGDRPRFFPRIAFDLNHGRSRPDPMSLLLCICASCRRQLRGLLLILCASTSFFSAPVSSQPPQTEIQGWSSEWLLGTTLELVSETDILHLRFASKDWVTVTTGKKDGPVTAPILSWHIKNGKLFIGQQASAEGGIEFVSLSGTTLITSLEGKKMIFKASR